MYRPEDHGSFDYQSGNGAFLDVAAKIARLTGKTLGRDYGVPAQELRSTPMPRHIVHDLRLLDHMIMHDSPPDDGTLAHMGGGNQGRGPETLNPVA